MAAQIRREIPEAAVRLFGSPACGQARPDSDIDLTDQGDRRLAQPSLRPVDLLLFSHSQVEQRQGLHCSVVHQACTHGFRLDG
jgi:DNA polymerase sigma